MTRIRSTSSVVGVRRSRRVTPAGPRTAGQATRQTIVLVAGRVLIQHGYAALTLRRVADAAGVSVGNLNYYFRTKESLLEALIEHVLADFSLRFEEKIIRRRVVDGSDTLAALLKWAMDGSCTHQYTRLVRELWAMATHNASVAAAMDRYYDQSIAAAMTRLGGSDDARHGTGLMALVPLICIIAEGASAVFGRRGRRHPQYAAVQRLACHLVVEAGRRADTPVQHVTGKPR